MECPICSEKFNADENCPKVLSCGHTVCERCLFFIIYNNEIQCPSCRLVVVSPSPHSLPKNHTLLSFISQTSDKTPQEYCKLHSTEPLIRYCFEDQIPVCAECVVHHSEHTILKLEDFYPFVRMGIESLVKRVESLQTLVHKTNLEFSEFENKMQEIEDLFLEVYERVQAEEGSLINTPKLLSGIESFISGLSVLFEQFRSYQDLSLKASCESIAQEVGSYLEELKLLQECIPFVPDKLSTEQSLVFISPDKNVLKYNLETQNWSEKQLGNSDFEYRDFSASANNSAKAYITGGLRSKAVYEFSNDQITKKCEMQECRSSHASVIINDTLYCLGGFNGSEWLDSCEKLNLSTGESRALANMNSKRCGFAACALEGFIYIFGGYDGFSYLDTIERYNLVKDQWEVLPCVLPRPLQVVGVEALSSYKILVGSSWSYRDLIKSLKVLETTSFTWSTLAEDKNYGYIYCSGHLIPLTDQPKQSLHLLKDPFLAVFENFKSYSHKLVSFILK